MTDDGKIIAPAASEEVFSTPRAEMRASPAFDEEQTPMPTYIASEVISTEQQADTTVSVSAELHSLDAYLDTVVQSGQVEDQAASENATESAVESEIAVEASTVSLIAQAAEEVMVTSESTETIATDAIVDVEVTEADSETAAEEVQAVVTEQAIIDTAATEFATTLAEAVQETISVIESIAAETAAVEPAFASEVVQEQASYNTPTVIDISIFEAPIVTVETEARVAEAVEVIAEKPRPRNLRTSWGKSKTSAAARIAAGVSTRQTTFVRFYVDCTLHSLMIILLVGDQERGSQAQVRHDCAHGCRCPIRS